MRVRKQTVAEIVTEVSVKMGDPNYSATMIGGFVQTQHPTAQYISAHDQEIGSTEAIMNTIFHASILALCFQRTHNRSVPRMSFEDLNQVAGDDVGERLQNIQPAIHEYIESNVESPTVKQVLYLVALAMESVT